MYVKLYLNEHNLPSLAHDTAYTVSLCPFKLCNSFPSLAENSCSIKIMHYVAIKIVGKKANHT